MEESRASRTAFRVAQRRAAHQQLDHPRVLEDPLAVAIVGGAVHEAARPASLRAFVAARSRYAEDELAHTVDVGVRQYVVLGAGLDTFAYRNPYEGLAVFEVDHPATQQWKRDRLSAAGIVIPTSVTFVAVDFERQSLAEELRSAGFSRHEPAFFSWLGVTPYLTERAFGETVAYIAAMPARSGVVFDYGVARSSLSFRQRLILDLLSARVAAAGEPFRLFFEPAELAARLRHAGFREIEDLNGDEINRRYFSDRADRLEVTGGLGRLLSARI